MSDTARTVWTARIADRPDPAASVALPAAVLEEARPAD